MTWDDVLALDDEGLNLAIERYCTTHQWRLEYYNEINSVVWVLRDADRTSPVYSSMPHMHIVTSWEGCMALAWRYRLSLRAFMMNRSWVVERGDEGQGIVIDTEAEARRAICQLAVWQALQEAARASV